MLRRFTAVILSVVLLSPGWLSLTGLTLPFALIPLLWISSTYNSSLRAWWGMFGWAALTFALWNIATIWWIWNATPVGPVAATLASTTVNMTAFMLFHTVSKKAPKLLAYTLLVTAWIATEYWYTIGDFSWPWLTLGNGFSHEVWSIQWYEYTGVFGGSLWVVLCNILFFEALCAPRSIKRWASAISALILPLALSLGIWWSWTQPDKGVVNVSVIQPNVDAYEKFDGDNERQIENILDLLGQVPPKTDFILLPETAVPGNYWEPGLSLSRHYNLRADIWRELADYLRRNHPEALLITGANTWRYYPAGAQPKKARENPYDGSYYDVFNTAVGIDSAGRIQMHHKGKLVIGVENTPTLIFDLMQFLVIDLGGVVGQLGQGQKGTAFEHNGVRIGPAICYEGLYGDFFGDFVRGGAQAMAIISNDGWWGDTPGYKHLFTISRLRAIEHRRAIARSANTGKSGFISARGDIGQTLGWEERGVISDNMPLNDKLTLYTRYGDYLGRYAQWVVLFCLLYYLFYRIRKRL